MWHQKIIKFHNKKRGFHLITDSIIKEIPEIKILKIGIAYFFIQHTSASLTINENNDPMISIDFENYFNKIVKENDSYYKHVFEGKDDITAHLKSLLLGNNISIPITCGKMNLGIWQGIYLCEHRNNPTQRNIVVTLQGQKY